MIKQCTKCKEDKEAKFFSPDTRRNLGLYSWCKECKKIAKREALLTNPQLKERQKEFTKKYHASPEYYRKVRAFQKANPEKLKAWKAVGWAKQTGKLKQLPCEVCGEKKTEAHHHDYTKPLDVNWLCRAHHRAISV